MIGLKRFIVFALMGAIMLSFSSCGGKKDFVFSKTGTYTVTDEETGVAFKAIVGEVQNRIVFTAPPAIEGLSAISNDGSYTLEYKGMKVTLGSFAVETAEDFFEALELLESAGVYKSGVLSATVDGFNAEAKVKNSRITELCFKNGLRQRKYIITTEATVWKTVQKQE